MHGQIQTEIQAWSWPVWLMSKALLWNQLGKAAGALNRTQRQKQREKKREGDCRAQIKFHCLFARPSPSLPPVLHHQPFLFYFFRNQAKPVKALQVKAACQSKPPYGSNQALHVRSGNPAVLKTTWLHINYLREQVRLGNRLVWKRTSS